MMFYRDAGGDTDCFEDLFFWFAALPNGLGAEHVDRLAPCPIAVFLKSPRIRMRGRPRQRDLPLPFRPISQGRSNRLCPRSGPSARLHIGDQQVHVLCRCRRSRGCGAWKIMGAGLAWRWPFYSKDNRTFGRRLLGDNVRSSPHWLAPPLVVGHAMG